MLLFIRSMCLNFFVKACFSLVVLQSADEAKALGIIYGEVSMLGSPTFVMLWLVSSIVRATEILLLEILAHGFELVFLVGLVFYELTLALFSSLGLLLLTTLIARAKEISNLDYI